jgi:hypothetical protein
MSVKDTIHSAGQNLHTIIITAREEDESKRVKQSHTATELKVAQKNSSAMTSEKVA